MCYRKIRCGKRRLTCLSLAFVQLVHYLFLGLAAFAFINLPFTLIFTSNRFHIVLETFIYVTVITMA